MFMLPWPPDLLYRLSQLTPKLHQLETLGAARPRPMSLALTLAAIAMIVPLGLDWIGRSARAPRFDA